MVSRQSPSSPVIVIGAQGSGFDPAPSESIQKSPILSLSETAFDKLPWQTLITVGQPLV